jgi:hypothetical protein
MLIQVHGNQKIAFPSMPIDSTSSAAFLGSAEGHSVLLAQASSGGRKLPHCVVVLGWRAKLCWLRWCDLSTPDAELMEVIEHPIEIRDP